MSEVQATTSKAKKSPLKTRYESLGYFYGQPLESFEAESNNKPTDLDIIRHWIFVEDQNRTTKSHSDINTVGIVTDNLMKFYIKYHPSVEIR